MFLCGNEEENYNLKLFSVFIIVEYENFFRAFIINKGFNFSYDYFVSNTAKIGVWGNSLNIIALSFLTSRAINVFESNNCVSYNPYFNPYHFPIILLLQNSHFVCALPINDESLISLPESNPFHNRFFNRDTLPEFIFY